MSRRLFTAGLAGFAALAAAGCATTMPAGGSAAGPTFADRLAIEATLDRYTRGLDGLDPDLYASAWAEDSEFDMGGTLYHGRDEIRGIITGVLDGSVASPASSGAQTFHMDANPRLEFLAPDHAVYSSYYFAISRTGEGREAVNRIIDSGATVDELKKIDGEWLLVKRTILDGP